MATLSRILKGSFYLDLTHRWVDKTENIQFN